MSTTRLPRDYRIVLRRNAGCDGDLSPPQFTVIVAARDPEDAISQAEKLVELLQGRFSVHEILDGDPPISRRG